MSQEYKDMVAEALEAVKEVEDADLRKSGFEIILQQLLRTKQDGASADTPIVAPKMPAANAPAPSGRANRTGLTDEEIQTLFEIKGETVVLKVEPTGTSVPEQQQMLAHAVLVGHLALLDKDNVSTTVMSAAARDWNLFDTNFSRTILTPGHVQSRGVRRGVNYSLKPGAVGKLKQSMQKMARGE